VEAVDEQVYRRTMAWNGRIGSLAVAHRPASHALDVTIDFPDPTALPHIVGRVRVLFDLGADPRAIAETLRRDPGLRPIVARHPGLRLPGCWDPFEVAVRAVVGQQVSVRAATTIMGRLVARLGTPMPDATAADVLRTVFPRPTVLAHGNLSGLGLTTARADTVARVAAAVVDGRVRLDGSCDTSTLVDDLTSLRGIGSWTAQYVAMRGLGDPDAFPSDDLGLRSAAGRVFRWGDERTATRAAVKALVTMAEAWRPWRAYAAVYLWHA